jgi:hypothetical protein
MNPDGSLIMGIVTIDLVNVINYNAISLIDFSYKRFNFCYGDGQGLLEGIRGVRMGACFPSPVQ